VLLADSYALPRGPDWSELPGIEGFRNATTHAYLRSLSFRKAQSSERGQGARRPGQFFAPHLSLDRIIDQPCDIKLQRMRSWSRIYRLQLLGSLLQLRADAKGSVPTRLPAASRTLRQLRKHKAPHGAPQAQTPPSPDPAAARLVP